MADFVQAPEQDVVISSRVRLARNYQDLPFSPKLTREAALECAFEAARGVPFEAYGVEDYLADYYRSGQPIETLRERVHASTEGEIGFAFTLPFETEGARLHDFLRALRAEGFFY